MKKNILLLLVLFLCAGELFSAPTGIGKDQPDEEVRRDKPAPAADRRIRALEFYIAGLMEKDPAKKITHLLESVRLDPQKRLPLQILVKTLNRIPASVPAVKKQIDRIRKDEPDNIFLAHQSVLIDQAAGCTPESIIRNIRPVLAKKPAKKDLRDFHPLAFACVDLLLKTTAPAEKLPFVTDDIPLKEAALFYYALAAKREKLSQTGTFAQTMHKKYLTELAQADFSGIKDLRRHLAILNAVKEYETAFNTARREVQKKKDPATLYLYMEAAACAGKTKILEQELKKYPALAVSFCSGMRYKSYLAAGNFSRAREELANFPQNSGRLEKLFTTAQMMRDVTEMKKILLQMESAHQKNNTLLALKYLSLAEISGDVSALEKAKNLLGTAYLQSPGLANAVGYVSAVLDTDLAGAELLLEFALSKEPRNAAYLDSMAWIKYKRRDYKQALEYIRKAFLCVDHGIGGAVPADHAGDIWQALGNPGKAQIYYQLALEFYQQNKVDNADLDPAATRKKLIKK